MGVNVPRAAEPDFIGIRVVNDVAENFPEARQAIGLADHEGMHRQAENQRLIGALAHLFVEMGGNHAGEIVGGMSTGQLSRGIVDFDMVRDRQNWARPGRHPERLIVRRPIHDVAVSVFLQQVGRVVAFRYPRPHPTAGTFAFVFAERFRRFGN